MTPKQIAILGAGDRGASFAALIRTMPELAQIAAIAEPRPEYRNIAGTERGFRDWKEFVAQPKFCDAVVIATPDREHAGAAVACLQKGYDVLLEKPMATTLDECRAIEAAQRASGALFGVCHSLRYQIGFRKVKELIADGYIGRLMALDLVEQVSFWHHAHSFVRGTWGNEGRAAFMLLTKSCHDIDYLAWLADRPCKQVSSFGALSWFRRENAPAKSAERCTDPCPLEPTCAYSALRRYVHADRTAWPANVVSHDHSGPAHLKALKTGPYGRCVWKCDNDVVDHQTVNLLFAGDITATFTMSAFTQRSGRKLRAHGSEAELLFDEETITIRRFKDHRDLSETLRLREHGLHGGGDARVLKDWLEALHSRDATRIVANAQESLKTHTIVFAAEKSRLESRTVSLAELQESVEPPAKPRRGRRASK
jgi:predicted dehydrogenase